MSAFAFSFVRRAFRLSGEKILASSGRYASTFFSTAKVDQDDLPGAGVVEFFLVDSQSPGVEIMDARDPTDLDDDRAYYFLLPTAGL